MQILYPPTVISVIGTKTRVKLDWLSFSPPVRWGLNLCLSPLLLLLVLLLSSSRLNRKQPRPVFSVGPQPRAATSSVPCQTSTTTSHVQCSLSDFNRDHLSPAFPCRTIWAQCSVPHGTSTAIVWAQRSLPDLNLQIECQKECQKNIAGRMSDRMPGDLPARMSEDMSEIMSDRNARRYARKNVRKYCRKNVRQNARRYANSNQFNSCTLDI